MSNLWPDLVVLGVILFSILVSFWRGFTKELLSLATWIVSAWLAYLLAKPFSSWVTFTEAASLKLLIAFIVIFVILLFIGSLVNFIVGKLIRKTPFSLPDRVLGIGFGFLRGFVIISLLVFFLGLTPMPKDAWWKNSYTLPRFEKVAIWMKGLLPDNMAKHFEFGDKIEEKQVKKA